MSSDYGTLYTADYPVGSSGGGYGGGLVYPGFPGPALSDSMILADQIELLGGGVPSQIPECAGAMFRLQPGWSTGAPVPDVDITASLALDGEIPIGRRASNRTFSLPIVITGTNRIQVIAAREVLMRAIDQPEFTLRFVREGSQLPIVYECFRAGATSITNSLPLETYGIACEVVLTFPAKPYGRSDVSTIVDFTNPISGASSPPNPIAIDSFSTVYGASNWVASSNAVIGPNTLYWDPSVPPMSLPTGIQNPTPPGTILNSDPMFAAPGIPSWTAFNGTVTAVTPPAGAPYPNSKAGKYVNNGVTAGALEENGTSLIPVAQGQSFLVGGYVYSSSTTARIGVDWKQSGGTYLSTSVATYTVTANTWTYLIAVVSAPDGALTCYARVDGGSGTLSNTLYAQNVTVAGALGATYAAGNLSANVSSGYSNVATAAGTVNTITIASTDPMAIGSQFRLWNSGSLKQSTIFTVTANGAISGGNYTIGFSPNANVATASGDVAIQTGPPNLGAFTLWFGFAAPNSYFDTWCRRGGPVRFAYQITDDIGNTLNFSLTKKVKGAKGVANPKWYKIRVPLASNTYFNYSNITSYAVTVTNRGTNDLQFTHLYLDTLTAVPVSNLVAQPQRGFVYDLSGIIGTARSPITLQAQGTGTSSYVKQFTTPGATQWLCPPGVTSVAVFAIGAGGNGAPFLSTGGGGGGGGGSAANPSVAVTPGTLYYINVGMPNPSQGSNGGNSIFIGDSATVLANGGHGTLTRTGASGGAAGTGGFAGGPGGNGDNATTGGGGAGGGSAGTSAAGPAGASSTSGTGGLPGTPVAGGGIGGRGGTYNIGNGQAPVSGFGGGSGGSPPGFGRAGVGWGGFVQLSYTATGQFATCIAHRPSYDGPETLCPFITLNPGDTPNGGIDYPVTSLEPSLNARFGSTYTIVAAAQSFTTPSVARTVTVSVRLWTAYSTITPTDSQSISLTFTPSALTSNLVILGELTLPNKELPPQNLNAYYTVTINDTITSDAFYDVLFLDTMGSTIIIQAPLTFANMFFEAPTDTRDVGYIIGSLFDLDDGISMLDSAIVTGGPLSVDPFGNQQLLLYSVDGGAPNVEMTYYPHWYEDRLA